MSDMIDRDMAKAAIREVLKGIPMALMTLPSDQPEITDEQAILHLQSTGWMQNHDREMYESGLREQLADDSGSYDSIIPCKDTISRQAAINALIKCGDHYSGNDEARRGVSQCIGVINDLPSAQSTQSNTPNALTALDCISRQAAIKAVESLPNCYNGYSDTYDKSCIIGLLEELPSAQPEIIRCKDCKHYQFADNRAFGMPVKMCEWFGFEDVDDDDFCSRAERRQDEQI